MMLSTTPKTQSHGMGTDPSTMMLPTLSYTLRLENWLLSKASISGILCILKRHEALHLLRGLLKRWQRGNEPGPSLGRRVRACSRWRSRFPLRTATSYPRAVVRDRTRLVPSRRSSMQTANSKHACLRLTRRKH
jgi:hypothetical protein